MAYLLTETVNITVWHIAVLSLVEGIHWIWNCNFDTQDVYHAETNWKPVHWHLSHFHFLVVAI